MYVNSYTCAKNSVFMCLRLRDARTLYDTHHISLRPRAIFAYTILTHSALPTTTVLKSKLRVLDPLAMKQGLTEDSLHRSSLTCDIRMTNAGGFQGMLLISSVSGACDASGRAVRIYCPLILPNQGDDFPP